MFFLSVFILHLMFYQLFLAEKSVEIDFIVGYTQKQISKSAVTAFLCWKSSDVLILTEELNKRNVQINTQNIDSYFINFHSKLDSLYVLDLSCENTLTLLEEANTNDIFRDPNHWLIINNTNEYYKSNLFKNLNIFVDSKVVLAQRSNQSDYYLEYLYKIHKGYDIILHYFAYWNGNQNRFIYYNNEPLTRKRKNLQLHELKASWVIFDNDTHNHMTDYRKPEVDTTTKLNYVLTQELFEFLNATSKHIYVPTWYRANTRDQTNTLIGTIYYREVDISGSPFFCIANRLTWMDCLAMTTPSKGYFIFRQPPLSYVKNIYVLPFEIKLWLTHIAFYLTSTILLYIIVQWEWKMLNINNKKPDHDMIDTKFSDMLLFTMGALCQQGYATEAKGTPGKILMLTIFLTLIFLFTAYSAYTVVLFQTTADNIKNLEDLYNSKIVLGIEDKPYYKEYFPKYTEPVRKKIYKDKIVPQGQPPHFYTMEEGMSRVRNEYFAFYCASMDGYKVIQDTFLENEKCGLQQLTYLYESDPWIVSPKNNTFKKLYKIGYRRLQDSGLLAREIKRRLTQKPECLSQGNSFRSAGFIDLYSVYMLLIIGVVMSVVILFVEIITHKLLNEYKNRQIH